MEIEEVSKLTLWECGKEVDSALAVRGNVWRQGLLHTV